MHLSFQDGLWYMVGLTSFGSGCAKPGFPDVFINIAHYKVVWNYVVKSPNLSQNESKVSSRNY